MPEVPSAWNDVRALTFDCYGTLVDWESGIANGLGALLESHGRTIPRAHVLERFAAVENTIQAAAPTLAYPRILERVANVVTASFGVVIRPAGGRGTSAAVSVIGPRSRTRTRRWFGWRGASGWS
jgi:hypothetical protein